MSPPVSWIWQRISLEWHGSWINTAAKQSQIKYMHHYTVYNFRDDLIFANSFNSQNIDYTENISCEIFSKKLLKLQKMIDTSLELLVHIFPIFTNF